MGMTSERDTQQTKTATIRIRKHDGTHVIAEVNPRTGDPQVFPFTEADSRVLAAVINEDGSGHLIEVAQSIRDHRQAYRAGHTLNCRGDLYRGLCH